MATILILDEEADSRTLLTRVLERMGHKIFAFKTGREASEWAGSHIPDLGIINVSQRRGPGIPVLGRLKEVNPDLKVMVITDGFSDELCEGWFVDDFVVKPVDIDQVEIKVQELLGSQPRNRHKSRKSVRP